MACREPESTEAIAVVEPVEPCTRHEFERIVQPIVKMAKRLVKANSDEMRGPDNDSPFEGVDTFEIRDAITAHLTAFQYWWEAEGQLNATVIELDDRKIAPMFLGTHDSRLRKSSRLVAGLNPDDSPEVCAARSRLQATMLHAGDRALLDLDTFRVFVLAAKGAKYVRVTSEDVELRAPVRQLSAAVRSLGSKGFKRTRDCTLALDWNVGGWCPYFVFTWNGGKGRLRIPLEIRPVSWTDGWVSLRCDRTVGIALDARLPAGVVALLPARCPLPTDVHAWPVMPSTVGEVSPENTNARVSGHNAEDLTMTTTTNTTTTATTTEASKPTTSKAPAASTTRNAIELADVKKWSISLMPARRGMLPMCTIYSNESDKSAKIAAARADTLEEAYDQAVKEAMAADKF